MQKNIKLNLVHIHFTKKHIVNPSLFVSMSQTHKARVKIKSGTKEEKDEAKHDGAQRHIHFALDSQQP